MGRPMMYRPQNGRYQPQQGRNGQSVYVEARAEDQWGQHTDYVQRRVTAEQPWSNGFWHFMIVLTVLAFICLAILGVYQGGVTLAGHASKFMPEAMDMMLSPRMAPKPMETARQAVKAKLWSKPPTIQELFEGTYTMIGMQPPVEGERDPTEHVASNNHGKVILVADNSKVLPLPSAHNEIVESDMPAHDDIVECDMPSPTIQATKNTQFWKDVFASDESDPAVLEEVSIAAEPDRISSEANAVLEEVSIAAEPDRISSEANAVLEVVSIAAEPDHISSEANAVLEVVSIAAEPERNSSEANAVLEEASVAAEPERNSSEANAVWNDWTPDDDWELVSIR